MIRFTCPSCGTAASAPEECGGRVAKCRGCGKPLVVPLAAGTTHPPPQNKPAPQGKPAAPATSSAKPPAQDKTALGRLVAAAASRLLSPMTATAAASPAKPPAQEKTALGRLVAHAPTAMKPADGTAKTSPPAQAKKPIKALRSARRPSSGPTASHRRGRDRMRRSRTRSLPVEADHEAPHQLLTVFAGGGLFGYGVYFYLESQSKE